jgi:hypothetical protein
MNWKIEDVIYYTIQKSNKNSVLRLLNVFCIDLIFPKLKMTQLIFPKLK